jgi:3-hydroxybutyryl-CoA dehydrogenase
VGVVGAGFMGSGIAETVARGGYEVLVHEPLPEMLERSRQRIRSSLDRATAAGKIGPDDAAALLGRFGYVDELDDLGGCPLVIETLVEDLGVKRATFRHLDERLPKDAILATNTSSLPIAEIGGATEHPSRVIGIHFSAPPPVMPVVEIVVSISTSPATLDRARAFVTSLGKHPIVSKDQAGFILNRLLIPYLASAVQMYADGFASREDIDAAMTLGCRHPMGPLELCDFIGLDVVAAICTTLHEEFKYPQLAPPPLLSRMVAAGRLGRKSGCGFYDYETGEPPGTS